MNTKQLIKELLPPVALRAVRRPAKLEADVLWFGGDFASWEEAQRASDGYSTEEILNRTCAATRKVRDNEAAFERDSVLFDEIEYPFPLLAGLLRAGLSSGQLSVLDFGGALGSTYFQSRNFLDGLKQLRWSVVEQPLHVKCGDAEFANEELRFYQTVDECLLFEKPNVLLLSGVVQYLPKPYDFLTEVLRHEFNYVIADRTAFMRNGITRLTVQHVPEWIYKASYPAWFLSEQRFIGCFEPAYKLIATFPALDATQPEGGEADYKGFMFQLNRQHE